jgi:hypothetical protein
MHELWLAGSGRVHVVPDFPERQVPLGDLVPLNPAWLDAAPLGECRRCGRKTWAAGELGAKDRMTQPDGGPCGGLVVALCANCGRGEDLHTPPAATGFDSLCLLLGMCACFRARVLPDKFLDA